MTSTILLEPGTRVRIKDHWESGIQNANGEMDHWLGETMTIKNCVGGRFYIMEEDEEEGPEYQDGHWRFVIEDFDVVDAVGDADTGLFVAPTDQDFLRLFGIGGE